MACTEGRDALQNRTRRFAGHHRKPMRHPRIDLDVHLGSVRSGALRESGGVIAQ
jgi:hypothetical protein